MNVKGRLITKLDLLSVAIVVIVSASVGIFNLRAGFCLFLVFLCILIVNKEAYCRNAYNAIHLFSSVGRNYKYLVISDWCDLREYGKSAIIFRSPVDRSSEAILQFVKRLYSLLDENAGTLVIISNRSRKERKGYSVFDIPYLHDITLARAGIVKMKRWSRFPVLFSVFGTLRLFIGFAREYDKVERPCPYKEITTFCNRRNIKLVYKAIQ